jgi:hypothetical protein
LLPLEDLFALFVAECLAAGRESRVEVLQQFAIGRVVLLDVPLALFGNIDVDEHLLLEAPQHLPVDLHLRESGGGNQVVRDRPIKLFLDGAPDGMVDDVQRGCPCAGAVEGIPAVGLGGVVDDSRQRHAGPAGLVDQLRLDEQLVPDGKPGRRGRHDEERGHGKVPDEAKTLGL